MAQLSTVDNAVQSAGIKGVIYGESGVGKTTLCATLPSPILISAEGGLLSLKSENIMRVYGSSALCTNIPVVQIQTYDEIDGVYNWLSQSAESGQFRSVYLDSLSEIGELILEDAKRKNRDLRMAYADTMRRVVGTIRKFRDLRGKHVFMACKIGDLESGQKCPSVPGKKLMQHMPYFFDEIFRLGVGKNGDNVFRYIATQPSDLYMAKDRSGALLPYEAPHLGACIQKIFGSV